MVIASKDHHFAAKVKHLMMPVIFMLIGTSLYMIYFFVQSTATGIYFLYCFGEMMIIAGWLSLSFKILTIPKPEHAEEQVL
jgi:hypothetical protein